MLSSLLIWNTRFFIILISLQRHEVILIPRIYMLQGYDVQTQIHCYFNKSFFVAKWQACFPLLLIFFRKCFGKGCFFRMTTMTFGLSKPSPGQTLSIDSHISRSVDQHLTY